jgi:S1-C subfamily serine protease
VRRAWAGFTLETTPIPRLVQRAAGLTDRGSGAMIRAVEAGGPADRAGLREGDILVALDGQAVTGVDDAVRLLSGERIGKRVDAAVVRGCKLLTFGVLAGERPR